MPRVHIVKKARKARPEHGIEVGDTYYYWEFRTGGIRYSKIRPRPSQLTQSEKLSRSYSVVEAVEDSIAAAREGFTSESTAEDLQSLLDIVADELDTQAGEAREIAEEYRESASSIRDTVSESPTADECDEKAGSLESMADEMETAASNIRTYDFDGEDLESSFESALEEAGGSLNLDF